MSSVERYRRLVVDCYTSFNVHCYIRPTLSTGEAMAQLSSAANSRLLEGLSKLYALATIEQLPHRILSLVHYLIGCDAASYNDIEVSSGQFRLLVDPEKGIDNRLEPCFERFVHQHPVIAHVQSTGDSQAHAISDFLRPVEFRRLGLYGEFFGPLGFNDQLSTTLVTARGSRILGIALNRAGGFTEQDRLILNALRPHFVLAHQNAIGFSEALGQSTADDSSDAAGTKLDHLTDRQREVLRLVSLGCFNQQVSAELSIRVGTVKKHLEHILGRLQVHNKLSAARIYFAGSRAPNDRIWWNVEGTADKNLSNV